MLPPPGASGSVIGIRDAFDVPVFVRRSSPLTPGGRPPVARVEAASLPWPAGGSIPPSGDYNVPTTWREVIDAAMTVGRDVTPWLASVPMLAQAELVARRSPLSAYLCRTPIASDPLDARYVVEPNVVYTDGTESTAKMAFGYRIGMTMAEWSCRGLMGLGATTHAEVAPPRIAGPEWSPKSGLPDLVGFHSDTHLPWLVEAKGSRKLVKSTLVKGAAQLCRPGLVHGPHVKVLCGTSLTDRLFVTLDVEERSGASRTTAGSGEDDRILALARSRMLIYLMLIALPSTSLSVLPVGAGVLERRRRNRRGGTGTVTLLEEDLSTRDERMRARRQSEDHQRPVDAPLDMLTAQVPGTDLVIGMSRRLFGACAALAPIAAEVSSAVDAERPPAPRGEVSVRVEEIDEERRFWRRRFERERYSRAAESTHRGFVQAANRRWDELVQRPVTFTPEPRPGFLEAATEETYLAIDDHSITTSQPPTDRR
jgi:hypothetical protein